MKLTRRTLLGSLAAAELAAQARKPNLIILLADDLGYGDLACYGSPDVPTPNIDSIARDGLRFTDGYVTAALCSPSRAGLLTGRYQQRFGHEFNPSGGRDREESVGLALDQTTIADRLRKLGFHTGAIGKWHLGATPKYIPLERGFDEYFGFLGGANLYYNAKTPGEKHNIPLAEAATAAMERAGRQGAIYRNREPVEEPQYLTEALGREAAAFIDRNRAKPFFLYTAFNAVHAPFQVLGKYMDRVPTIKDERHRILAAMTVALDDAVGVILDKLRATGLERDTLVCFLSDNGCPIRFRAGSNKPLNGQKATYYEGGMRVPFIWRWPGRIKPGGTFTKPVMSFDITATMLKLAGGTISAAPEMDGVDLMPYLTGGKAGDPHERLFWRAGRVRTVRQGNWKLIDMADQGARLYDLSADLGEKSNLATQRPEIVKQLTTALDRWTAQLAAPRWKGFETILPVNGEQLRWDG